MLKIECCGLTSLQTKQIIEKEFASSNFGGSSNFTLGGLECFFIYGPPASDCAAETEKTNATPQKAEKYFFNLPIK